MTTSRLLQITGIVVIVAVIGWAFQSIDVEAQSDCQCDPSLVSCSGASCVVNQQWTNVYVNTTYIERVGCGVGSQRPCRTRTGPAITGFTTAMVLYTDARSLDEAFRAGEVFRVGAYSDGEVVSVGVSFFDTPPVVFAPQGTITASLKDLFKHTQIIAVREDVTIQSSWQDEWYVYTMGSSGTYNQPTDLVQCQTHDNFIATCTTDSKLDVDRIRVEVRRRVEPFTFKGHYPHPGSFTGDYPMGNRDAYYCNNQSCIVMIASTYVDIVGPNSPSVALYANGHRYSTIIDYGEDVDLTWTSQNATSCTASGGWSGTRELNSTTPEIYIPLTTTDYTLTCQNDEGDSADDTVTVTVLSPPETPTPTPSPTPTTPGTTECSDGVDNDGDTFIDSRDPGCWTDITDPSTYDPNDDDEYHVPEEDPGGFGETD